MTEALFLTHTGVRIVVVPDPPPPEWRLVRWAPPTVLDPSVLTQALPLARTDRVCRRITGGQGWYPLYEEIG